MTPFLAPGVFVSLALDFVRPQISAFIGDLLLLIIRILFFDFPFFSSPTKTQFLGNEAPHIVHSSFTKKLLHERS